MYKHTDFFVFIDLRNKLVFNLVILANKITIII